MEFKRNELGFSVMHDLVYPNDPILGMDPISALYMSSIDFWLI